MTETLIKEIKKVPDLGAKIGPGWVKKLRYDFVKPNDDMGTFADINALIVRLAQEAPPISEKKRIKNKERSDRKRKHEQLVKNVNTTYATHGKRIRDVSYKGAQKYNVEYLKTQHHLTNVTNLQNTFHTTPTGQVHDLTTGNEYQSMIAFSNANLPQNTRGATLEGVYMPTHMSVFPPPVPQHGPYGIVPDRLRLTTASDDGSYKTGVVSDSTILGALELNRFLEDVYPTLMRDQLVGHNVITSDFEHDPVGKYALYEVPLATKPTPQVNSLINQNTWNIYQDVKQLPDPHDIVLGRNVHMLDPQTNFSTLGDFFDAMDEYEKNPNKETQNNLTRQGFYAQRGNMGYHCDTPPGSPFHGEY